MRNGTASPGRRWCACWLDLRKHDTQSPSVAALIKDGVDNMYRPGDRVAMVVASTVVKMQMRRVTNPAFVEIFTAIEDAEKWMLAGPA